MKTALIALGAILLIGGVLFACIALTTPGTQVGLSIWGGIGIGSGSVTIVFVSTATGLF